MSGPAPRPGVQALADRGRAVAAERARAARPGAVLSGAGLRLAGGTAPLRPAETQDARAVFDRLGQTGSLVRRFAAGPHRPRVGLPRDAGQMDRLARASAGHAGTTRWRGVQRAAGSGGL